MQQIVGTVPVDANVEAARDLVAEHFPNAPVHGDEWSTALRVLSPSTPAAAASEPTEPGSRASKAA